MRVAVISLLCLMAAGAPPPASQPERFSWQQAHARVTETGDLQWAPHPFVFEAAPPVRYIDYEHGSDDNPGTRALPWKHHPWDAQAAGNAARAAGVRTCVFKRGVVYRGSLVARESGSPRSPVRLTSDPSWGSGEAAIYGSRRVTGGWTRAGPSTAPGIPSPDAVWYRDLGADFVPHSVWLVDGEAVTRILPARDPNWTITNPEDLKSNWYRWERVETAKVVIDGKEEERVWAADPVRLTAKDRNDYDGGIVWTEYGVVVSMPFAMPIEAYDPERHAIRIEHPFGADRPHRIVPQCRYYLENLPRFLDSPGEYYLVTKGPLAGRLYVRLPHEQNPNEAVIELADRRTLIEIRDRSNIRISGLAFRFGNVPGWYSQPTQRGDPEGDPACVKALGACRNIRIANCKFEHIARAFVLATGGEGITDDIAFNDNEIQYADYGPIRVQNRGLTPPAGNLYRLEILRNRLYEVGRRAPKYDNGQAMQVYFAMLPEIAGNILDRCWGAGIFVWGGKASSQHRAFGGREHGALSRPLTRILIHHNKVTNTLLNLNDYGSIEFWQNGPAYIFNNISGAPGGYRYWRDIAIPDPAKRTHLTSRFGFPYYLDGGFKAYLFNNVAWGRSGDPASPLAATSAFHEVVGFMNAFFNNTAYRFAAPFRRQMSFGGHGAYLGNLVMDSGEVVFRHADITRPEDTDLERAGVKAYPNETTAYANNVFVGRPRGFGYYDLKKSFATLDGFRAALEKERPLASQTGWQVEGSPVVRAEELDFRPRAGSAVIDRGVKFFVPWALSGVVGEWPFFKVTSAPARILGQNWFPTEEYENRDHYHLLPHNELTAHNTTGADYGEGILEDWVDGALRFNGRDRYCSLADAKLWQGSARSRSCNLDMDANSFLVEAVFRTAPAHTGGVLVSKLGGSGYALDIDGAGRARLRLAAAGSECARASLLPVNDGKWHHLIAEADRGASPSIRIYVDGKPANGRLTGTMPAPGAALSNTADFLVGKGRETSTSSGSPAEPSPTPEPPSRNSTDGSSTARS